MTERECILELRDISKDFPGVRALDRVNVGFRRGTVHALVGENGAGKSTLMKILAGLCSGYEGTIRLHGRPLSAGSVRERLRSGIAMIHQELMYVPQMTVAANVLLGKEPASRFLKRIDMRESHRQTRQLLAQVGLDLDPDRLMRDLSIAERQMVEIAKAVSYNAEIIIMDEPSSALSQREIVRLFDLIADLKDRGVTIIYISHKLDEVFRMADEVTVLRDGQVITTCAIDAVDADKLVALMVGRELADVFPKRTGRPGAEILAVNGLTRQGVFHDVSFTLRRGEILGLAGLMGAGRTEVIRCLFGLDRYDGGRILIDGREATLRNPADAQRLGLGLVSEDRQITGLVPCLSLGVNMTLANLRRCAWGPVVVQKQEQMLVNGMVRDLKIKATHSEQRVSCLSGGNQQKVVLAKALLGQPEILLLDEPTRGIDVGAKAEIYELMRGLADAGKAIIMVSSELPEIMGMSDRVLVFKEGAVTGRLSRDQIDPETIMRYAMTN